MYSPEHGLVLIIQQDHSTYSQDLMQADIILPEPEIPVSDSPVHLPTQQDQTILS